MALNVVARQTPQRREMAAHCLVIRAYVLALADHNAFTTAHGLIHAAT